MANLRHYPFLDKETDIAGLEPFDYVVVIAIPLLIAVFLFILTPFQIIIAIGFVLTVIVLYVIARIKKSAYQRGFLYREVYYNFLGRNIKRFY